MSGKEKTVSEYRLEIGVNILKAMIKNNEFPISCKGELTDKIMKYFFSLGYEDRLYEIGSSWLPTSEYWGHRLSEIQDKLKEDNIYLEGTIFVGDWKICNKNEFDERMRVKRADCNSRMESYNGKISDANRRWKNFNFPLGERIPELTN